jgi:hypothetical protein
VQGGGPGTPRAKTGAQVEAESLAESKQHWNAPGQTTDTRFAVHENNFNTLLKTLRDTQAKLQEKGRAALLPVINDQIVRMVVKDFIKSRPRLVAHRDAILMLAQSKDLPELKAGYDNFVGEGEGKLVGLRRPDIVEFFLDNSRIVVTDITTDPLSMVHNFKTLFYVEVMRAMLGDQGPVVSGMDINPDRNPPVVQNVPPDK